MSNEEANLTINDIRLAMQVINLAAQRGAIKPEEMVEVGGLYSRLNAFVEAIVAEERNKKDELETGDEDFDDS